CRRLALSLNFFIGLLSGSGVKLGKFHKRYGFESFFSIPNPLSWDLWVKGACKNLVGRRLKQTGACWEVGRVNRMGVLCTILYGDQWKAYWKTAV
ncbi:MAG: hypothetical protein ACRC2T_11645, partial [Thermoguttaceae bacterium]